METFLVTLTPDTGNAELLSHDGEEFLVVMEGAMRHQSGAGEQGRNAERRRQHLLPCHHTPQCYKRIRERQGSHHGRDLHWKLIRLSCPKGEGIRSTFLAYRRFQTALGFFYLFLPETNKTPTSTNMQDFNP
jgi:hypothetical protein